jgi:hypothetical protein
MPIEHLMPQSWRENWPVADDAASGVRDDHVHRFGNLTLLTKALNSKVSNGPWLGAGGKLEGIARHSILEMNRKVCVSGSAGWDEAAIDRRSAEITEALLATWPVPPGHEGIVRHRDDATPSWVEISDLLRVGLLQGGQVVVNKDLNVSAVITPPGHLRMADEEFASPSAAASRVRNHAANGWYFWSLEDGRRLNDVRDDYRAQLTQE